MLGNGLLLDVTVHCIPLLGILAGFVTASRMQQSHSPGPGRGMLLPIVLHLLDAAFRHRVALPMADLRPAPPPAAHIPWLGLLVRGATKDGRDLFEVFASLDEATDLGWEYLGDELAARGHATFAVELRTRTRPTLRVHAGPAPLDGPLGSAPFVFQLLSEITRPSSQFRRSWPLRAKLLNGCALRPCKAEPRTGVGWGHRF